MKEAVAAKYELLSRNMHGRTEEEHNKLVSWYLVSEPIFDTPGSYVTRNTRRVHVTVVAVQEQ